MRGFAALEPWRHRHPGQLSPLKHCVLTQSPEAHQNLAGSTPEMCSGVHQKGCDLEGVEGATLHATFNSLTYFKTMTEQNTHHEPIELTDELLENISGGLDIDDDPDLDTSWWYKRMGLFPIYS